MGTEPDENQTFDPNQRRLCPDGSCVGIIGEDEKCKVCGTVDPAGPQVAGMTSEISAPAPEPEPMTEPEPGKEGGFDPNRRLCADETCIGVLDEQGRCKLCGRSG